MHPEYDAVDLIQMKLLAQLSPGQRLQTMLAARELAVSLKRGRLHRQFPELSIRDLNLKLLDELAYVQRTDSRP